MEEWREYKLGEVCNMIPGFAFKSKDFGIGKNIAIKIKDIRPPYVEIKEADNVDTSNYNLEKLSKFLVHKGEFLLAMTGATIGKIGRYICENPAYVNQRVLKFEDAGLVLYDYLYYYLSTDVFQSFITNHIDSQSAQPNISSTTIGKYPITIPSIKVQKRIASILKSLDDKIEVNRKINENLEQQAQALFKSWFVDFEPFKNGEFVESELGMIPKGWRVGTLNEIALINPSRTLRKGETAAYLDMKNMPTSGPFPLYCESKEYTGGMRFQNQDTLMARITPCLENGKVAYVNFLNDGEIAFGSTEYIVMTTKNGFMPELLYFLCRDESFKSYATKNMNGSSGRQRVSGETIGDYKIAIPPKSLISPIAPYLKSVMDNIKNNGFESRRLAQLRDTLLPRLMSGELKVNEIENVL